MDIKEYTESNEDIYFIMYNVFNDFYIKMQLSSKYYYEGFKEFTNERNLIILVLFLSSIIVSLIGMTILAPVVSQVNKERVKVLSLFVAIPQHFNISLSNKCENFLNTF